MNFAVITNVVIKSVHCIVLVVDAMKCFPVPPHGIISSPEPKAQGELLPSANVRRPSCDMRRASSTIASNDISSETARPRTLIFGM